MQNGDGFDFQKLDHEVDELLSDVKELLNDAPQAEPEAGITEEPVGEAPEQPEDADAADAEAAGDPMLDATMIYKPLTFYEQSKPAYQTQRRALYEREREQARQERERQRLAREAEEERKMRELEERQKKPRRRSPEQPPEDEQEYARWLYEQGGGEETVRQREVVAQREQTAAQPRAAAKKRHPVRNVLLILLALLLAGTAMLVVLAKQPKTDNALGARRADCATILLAGTDQDGFRTDTMMLLSIDRSSGKISLVSIPRDTLVYCEYAVPKINSAYGWAGGGESGMEELMQRVSEIVGFMPDGYVLIGLEGFEKLIDCMGGVEFDVPMDMQYSDPSQELSIDLKAGTQRLDGTAAMQLVRFRSGYALADLDRVTVQRAFVKAALSQWISLGKIYKLPAALRVLKQYTQSDLDFENYLWMAEAALFCDMESVRMETLPGTATYIAGGSYYVLDPAGVAETVNNCCNPYEQGIAVSDLSIRIG